MSENNTTDKENTTGMAELSREELKAVSGGFCAVFGTEGCNQYSGYAESAPSAKK